MPDEKAADSLQDTCDGKREHLIEQRTASVGGGDGGS